MTTSPKIAQRSQSNSLLNLIPDLEGRTLADFGAARFQDQIFDAVLALWRRREKEGWTKNQVAVRIGRDKSWVSRNLRAPGNWTIKTAGELIQALDGDSIVIVEALEDAPSQPQNYNAYDGYLTTSQMIKQQIVIQNLTTEVTIARFPANDKYIQLQLVK